MRILVAVLLCTALITRAEDAQKPFGLGLVDPAGDCAVREAKGSVALTVPGGLRDLSGYSGDNSAPRMLREVTGDFTVTVKVTGDFKPAKRQEKNSFNGAGLLIWDTAKNFVRVERNIWVSPDSKKYSYTPLIEYWKDGENLTASPGTDKPIWKGRSTYLRVIRSGDKLAASLSHDGKRWVDFEQFKITMPQTVKVGIAAINTAPNPFKVTFSEFDLTAK